MLMAVKAKMFLNSITMSPASGGGTVNLAAVCRGEINKEWAQYTPSGQLSLTIKAGPAFDFFVALMKDKQDGKVQHPEVFITIERATEPDE